jgi:hypothetical protein
VNEVSRDVGRDRCIHCPEANPGGLEPQRDDRQSQTDPMLWAVCRVLGKSPGEIWHRRTMAVMREKNDRILERMRGNGQKAMENAEWGKEDCNASQEDGRV